jgi:hypothetical protein
MAATDLTSAERGVLLALMAAGRPLKEARELRDAYGIRFTETQRTKLQKLGLIETTNRPRTHALSKKGWEWAWNETAQPKPKGQMGLGALYAVLKGVRRYAEQQGGGLQEIFGDAPVAKAPASKAAAAKNGAADPARKHMHEAAWSEADEALGQALQDMAVLTKAIEALQKAEGPADINRVVKRTSAAAKLVVQSIRHAGRKRELTLLLEPGSETEFDPAIHRSDESAKAGDRVRIRKPPVFRGPESNRVTVLLGEVETV